MRRVIALFSIVVVAGCSAAAPSPSQRAATASSPSPVVCPSVAIVRAFLAASQRFDGVAGAALFTPDGYIDGVVVKSPYGRFRVRGDGIRKVITHSPQDYPDNQLRAVDTFREPQGCDAVVTFGQRNVQTAPGPPFDLGGTATVQDGKIASIVYEWENR